VPFDSEWLLFKRNVEPNLSFVGKEDRRMTSRCEEAAADIVEGFDSVYVSLYKGIGGISGAILAGDPDFITQARMWRRRMGGTLPHQSPVVVSAAMRIDARLAAMPAFYERTVSLAVRLNCIDGIRTVPTLPQSNMLHIVFDADCEAVLDARDAIAGEDRIWLVHGVSGTDVPGQRRTELYVGDALLSLSDDLVVPSFEKLIKLARMA
jgi:hypothetical protein